jgi:hypothetical protein
MTRIIAELPKGNLITDFINLGVVGKTFPLTTVKSVLAATGRRAFVKGICRRTRWSTM